MHEQPGAASGDRPDADPVFAQRIMVCASAQKSIHTAVQSPELRYVRATVTECPLLRTGRASAATCVCTRVHAAAPINQGPHASAPGGIPKYVNSVEPHIPNMALYGGSAPSGAICGTAAEEARHIWAGALPTATYPLPCICRMHGA